MSTGQGVLQKKIERLVRGLEKYGAEKGILFGSSARGDIDKWSDIDLIVIKQTDRRFLDRLKDVYEAIEPDFALDVLVYTPEEFEKMKEEERPFLMHALEGAKVIYERPED
jgi:predicted nucleotidyltransferase